MAAGVSSPTTLNTFRISRITSHPAKPLSSITTLSFLPVPRIPTSRHRLLTVSGEQKPSILIQDGDESGNEETSDEQRISSVQLAKRLARKKSERYTYLVAAMMSSFGITSMAIAGVYYRFASQLEGGEVPISEMFGTFALAVGAAVGMEFWARWAHRALWHASLWHMHESHHRPRDGPFELNDVFAIINAVPAIALLVYGFFNKGLIPGLCFGALHHADKFKGVPFGLFLGPKELEEVDGTEELEKEISRRIKL